MGHLRQRLLFTCCGALLASSFFPSQAHAQITVLGQQGCAAGTVVGGPNLVANGDFSSGNANFTSDLQRLPDDTYPDDSNGPGYGYSIQHGYRTYYNGNVVGKPFPGDSQRDMPATNTYFYSNPVPVANKPILMLWSQTVTNLSPGTTYNFYAYFDNLLIPGSQATDPLIELQVDGVSAGDPITVPESPDAWIPVQFSFTTAADQTSATLSIRDHANNKEGDDFGMTQISLKQCVSGLGLAKSVGAPQAVGGGAYDLPYTITLKNYGVDPLPLTEVNVTDNLASVFAKAQSFQVVSLQSSTLTVNPQFNGTSDIRLLATGNSLSAGSLATISFVVRVKMGPGPGGTGPFNNTANVSAFAGNVLVTDISTPGSDPDPNNNGDPKDTFEADPTVISIGQTTFLPLMLVK